MTWRCRSCRAAWFSETWAFRQLFGEPLWLQAEEVPDCDRCGRAMEFLAQLAQLEQGPDWRTEMNFGGGGVAYLFQL
ncbi:hypothetical protein GCM10023339_79590 [Alloalcanivorax gelatiniphagus]